MHALSKFVGSIVDPLLCSDRGAQAASARTCLSHRHSDLFWLAWAEVRAVGGRTSDDSGARAGAPRRRRLSAAVGKTYAWCILVLTFTTSYEVFARYMFLAPTDWAFDASYMLYGTLFMMAGAYALSRNAHVRGDFLYRAWPPRRQAGMDLVLYFLFFFPGMIAFVYAGYGFAELSRHDERALRRQPQRPDRLAVQDGSSVSSAC